MRAMPTRRSLFDGAAAVVLGGCITAGVAASAADFLPGEGADAVLLALCTHAEAADNRSINAFHSQTARGRVSKPTFSRLSRYDASHCVIVSGQVATFASAMMVPSAATTHIAVFSWETSRVANTLTFILHAFTQAIGASPSCRDHLSSPRWTGKAAWRLC